MSHHAHEVDVKDLKDVKPEYKKSLDLFKQLLDEVKSVEGKAQDGAQGAGPSVSGQSLSAQGVGSVLSCLLGCFTQLKAAASSAPVAAPVVPPAAE